MDHFCISSRRQLSWTHLLHFPPVVLFNLFVLISSFYPEVSGKLNIERISREYDPPLLFPLIDIRLSASEQQELFENFENHEEKVIGEGRHEELHTLLETFKIKYLI